MKKIRIGIWDTDRDYARKLAGYLMQKYGERLEVHGYGSRPTKTEMESLQIFLTSEREVGDEISQSVTVLCLAEGRDEPGIFKYQPAEVVYRQILGGFQQPESDGGAGRIRAFYTPGNQSRQEKEVIKLAERMSQDRRTLLIYLTQCGGLGMDNEREDLTEVVYKIRHKRCTVGEVQAIQEQRTGYWVITCAQNPARLAELTGEDYRQFMELVQKSGDWEEILLDIGLLTEGIYALLRMADEVWTFESAGKRRKHLEYLLAQIDAGKKLRNTDEWKGVLYENGGDCGRIAAESDTESRYRKRDE